MRRDPPPKFRGRLQLLYDEWGTLKCETCFQCAQACPIECIDMGGIDTRGRFHVHWGAPETYGERREESALRRSGRPVPDPAYQPFAAIDPASSTRSSRRTITTRPRCWPSSRRRRRPTATCRSRPSSGSASRRAPGTRCSTARRPTTAICGSSRRRRPTRRRRSRLAGRPRPRTSARWRRRSVARAGRAQTRRRASGQRPGEGARN